MGVSLAYLLVRVVPLVCRLTVRDLLNHEFFAEGVKVEVFSQEKEQVMIKGHHSKPPQ